MKQPTQTFTAGRLEPIWPLDGRTFAIALVANLSLKKGTVIGQVSSANASEVQSLAISGTPTGGTFTLTFGGLTTGALAFNSTASQVQAALQGLASIGSGNVTCSGGALPGTAVTITFAGDLANQPQPLVVVSASLTGGTSPAAMVTRTTTGIAFGKWAAYNSGNSDGTQTAKAILAIDASTDAAGHITLGPKSGGGQWGETQASVPAFFRVLFSAGERTGFVSGGANAIGRILAGSLSDGLLKLA